jgi:hypothetical protein
MSGRLLTQGSLWQSGNAKKTKFPFPSPTSCCSDVPVFATSESMNFIVSATTESLSSTWRAPRYRGRLLHALTRGQQETITPFLPFGGAGIERARLNMFAKPCRVPTMLVGRDHRSGLPLSLTLMHPADFYVMRGS